MKHLFPTILPVLIALLLDRAGRRDIRRQRTGHALGRGFARPRLDGGLRPRGTVLARVMLAGVATRRERKAEAEWLAAASSSQRPGEAPDIWSPWFGRAQTAWLLAALIDGPIALYAVRGGVLSERLEMAMLIPLLALIPALWNRRDGIEPAWHEVLRWMARYDRRGLAVCAVVGLVTAAESAARGIPIGMDIGAVGLIGLGMDHKAYFRRQGDTPDHAPEAAADHLAEAAQREGFDHGAFYAIADSVFGGQNVCDVAPLASAGPISGVRVGLEPAILATQVASRAKALPSLLAGTFGGEWLVEIGPNFVEAVPMPPLSAEEASWLHQIRAVYGDEKVATVSLAGADGEAPFRVVAQLRNLLAGDVDRYVDTLRSEVGSDYRIVGDGTARTLEVTMAPKLPAVVDPDPLELGIGPHRPWFIGIDEDGARVEYDIAAGAHLFIGGATRSGKSVCTYGLVGHVAAMGENARLLIADPNDTTVAPFEHHAFWATSDVTPAEPTAMLQWCRQEMDRRKPLLRQMRSDKLTEFSAETPLIVMVIDEAANYLRSSDKVAAGLFRDELLAVVSQGAKYGVRLVLITQRPDNTILDTSTRAQLGARICFRVEDNQTATMVFPELEDASVLLGLPSGVGMFKEPGEQRRNFKGIYHPSHWDLADSIPIPKSMEATSTGGSEAGAEAVPAQPAPSAPTPADAPAAADAPPPPPPIRGPRPGSGRPQRQASREQRRVSTPEADALLAAASVGATGEDVSPPPSNDQGEA